MDALTSVGRLFVPVVASNEHPLNPNRSLCFMSLAFRSFHLQPPPVAPGSICFRPGLTSFYLVHPVCRNRLASWASPFPSRLATTTGRIEFVILRTDRSPPVALHPASRRRSYFQLQCPDQTSVETRIPLTKLTHRRTRMLAPPCMTNGDGGLTRLGRLGDGRCHRFVRELATAALSVAMHGAHDLYRFQGREFRLTDIAGEVVQQLVA